MFDHIIWTVIWGAIIFITFISELLSAAITSVWFTLGGIAALILHLLGAPVWLQILTFLFVTSVGMFLLRKLWQKKLQPVHTATNLDRYIGTAVLITQDVDNLLSKGEIRLNGQLWTAKSLDDDIRYAVGERVIISRFEGSKVFVTKDNS